MDEIYIQSKGGIVAHSSYDQTVIKTTQVPMYVDTKPVPPPNVSQETIENAPVFSTNSALSTVRIIYVEDHEVTRVGTKQLLRRIAPEVFIQEVQCYSQLVDLSAHDQDFDLLLLDLSLPDVTGIVQVSSVKSMFPIVPIAVFTAHEDPQLVMSAMMAGASGFLLKKSPSRTILQAIQLILDGEVFFPRQLITQFSEDTHHQDSIQAIFDSPQTKRPQYSLTSDHSSQSDSVLTPRQTDVLSLVVKGLSNKEIARALGISVGTTKNHVAEILRLLGCNNRRDAICKVLNGNIHLDDSCTQI